MLDFFVELTHLPHFFCNLRNFAIQFYKELYGWDSDITAETHSSLPNVS